MPDIRTSIEAKRGCGYRQAGGIYLVAGKPERDCGRLPHRLEICPTCSHGIKPSRGWTWVNGRKLFEATPCPDRNYEPPSPDLSVRGCSSCPLSDGRLADGKLDRCGLLWIGEKFYSTPEEYLAEARAMGLSRRIQAVPHDFKLGETWVLLAHRKGITETCAACNGTMDKAWDCDKDRGFGDPPPEAIKCDCDDGKVYTPAIFSCYLPTAVEYIVKGDESEEELERLEKRGFSLVKVVPKKNLCSMMCGEEIHTPTGGCGCTRKAAVQGVPAPAAADLDPVTSPDIPQHLPNATCPWCDVEYKECGGKHSDDAAIEDMIALRDSGEFSHLTLRDLTAAKTGKWMAFCCYRKDPESPTQCRLEVSCSETPHTTRRLEMLKFRAIAGPSRGQKAGRGSP
jgi:hypothetical protein